MNVFFNVCETLFNMIYGAIAAYQRIQQCPVIMSTFYVKLNNKRWSLHHREVKFFAKVQLSTQMVLMVR